MEGSYAYQRSSSLSNGSAATSALLNDFKYASDWKKASSTRGSSFDWRSPSYSQNSNHGYQRRNYRAKTKEIDLSPLLDVLKRIDEIDTSMEGKRKTRIKDMSDSDSSLVDNSNISSNDGSVYKNYAKDSSQAKMHTNHDNDSEGGRDTDSYRYASPGLRKHLTVTDLKSDLDTMDDVSNFSDEEFIPESLTPEYTGNNDNCTLDDTVDSGHTLDDNDEHTDDSFGDVYRENIKHVINNPQESSAELNNPHESSAELNNPHESSAELNNPNESSAELNNPNESSAELNNPHESFAELNNPHETSAVLETDKSTDKGRTMDKVENRFKKKRISSVGFNMDHLNVPDNKRESRKRESIDSDMDKSGYESVTEDDFEQLCTDIDEPFSEDDDDDDDDDDTEEVEDESSDSSDSIEEELGWRTRGYNNDFFISRKSVLGSEIIDCYNKARSRHSSKHSSRSSGTGTPRISGSDSERATPLAKPSKLFQKNASEPITRNSSNSSFFDVTQGKVGRKSDPVIRVGSAGRLSELADRYRTIDNVEASKGPRVQRRGTGNREGVQKGDGGGVRVAELRAALEREIEKAKTS